MRELKSVRICLECSRRETIKTMNIHPNGKDFICDACMNHILDKNADHIEVWLNKKDDN